MKKAFCKVIAFIFVVYVGAGHVTNSQTSNRPNKTADVKIRQRMSMGNGAGTETVLYIKGQRMRNEMGGNVGFTTILQCDLKRTLTINERTKTYMVSSTNNPNTAVAGDGGPSGTMTPMPTQQTPTRGGVVNITNTITDTGERKEMFGFTARRIKTSMEKKASPDACDKDQKVETDGWYIDFQYAFECPGETQKHPMPPVQSRPGCKDEIRSRTVGTAKLGYPLHVTTTIYQPDGRTSTMTQEVLELSREPLSASLFGVPEGYALAKDMQELYGMGGSTAPSVSNRPPADNSTGSTSSKSESTSTTPAGTTEKKPGVLRIGLVIPKVQVNAGNPAQTAEAVRNGFAQYLKGPTVEVMPLTAQLPSAVIEEARRSQCDYVVFVSMTIKKGGGGSMFGRAIGNIAGSASGHIPGGGSAATGAARSAAITGVYTTAAIAASIKAKDELSLEYKLDKIEPASTLLTNTAKAKAKSDGEDIIAPQIEAAAQTIISTIRR